MIPGPIEISPAVREAFGAAPPGHLAPRLIDAFGASLAMMRQVWQADASSQPFIVAGGGTLAMDMAVSNLVEPGERVVLVNSGFFSDRMSEMLRRAGADVIEVRARVGEAPAPDDVARALDGPRVKALFATHVDTSTGVRIDPRPLAALARERETLSIFDGVCATAAEQFEMAGWDADVYLTASQKAIGLPPGLALMVVSSRALAARETRRVAAPPMYLDWGSWRPIMQAYEGRRPAYFSTPATNLILALEIGLGEILEAGIEARVAMHDRAGRAMRAAWNAMGLGQVPLRAELAANTLSAVKLPSGVDPSIVGRIMKAGVVVAGGLHPEIRETYFRVGHMGYSATQPEMLLRTVSAIGSALAERGAVQAPDDAVAAANVVLESPAVS